MAHGRLQANIDPQVEAQFNEVFSRIAHTAKLTKKAAIEQALVLWCYHVDTRSASYKARIHREMAEHHRRWAEMSGP